MKTTQLIRYVYLNLLSKIYKNQWNTQHKLETYGIYTFKDSSVFFFFLFLNNLINQFEFFIYLKLSQSSNFSLSNNSFQSAFSSTIWQNYAKESLINTFTNDNDYEFPSNVTLLQTHSKDINNLSNDTNKENDEEASSSSKCDYDLPDIPVHLLSADAGGKNKKPMPSSSDCYEYNKNGKDKDEAVVKCLYYSLMCCECNIS